MRGEEENGCAAAAGGGGGDEAEVIVMAFSFMETKADDLEVAPLVVVAAIKLSCAFVL
jgi:hypothetical protein